MYPRLYLARNLLREDGVIFVSRRRSGGRKSQEAYATRYSAKRTCQRTVSLAEGVLPQIIAKSFSSDHDYIVVYAKNEQRLEANLLDRERRARMTGTATRTMIHAVSGISDVHSE